MTLPRLDRWLHQLGYDPASKALHCASAALAKRHPYAPELHDLLNPHGEIRAEAVFDVEGVPTVSFFIDDGTLDDARLSALRQRIWNQGLISIVLIVRGEEIVPVPVTVRESAGEALPFGQARRDGRLSRADVQSGNIRERYPAWFRLEDRVDRKLLANLRLTVQTLTQLPASRLSREQAQYLVGQVLFVSYLEHRGIVGERYRRTHEVRTLQTLVAERDRPGLVRLFDQLKTDFNGDFLDRAEGTTSLWAELSDDGYQSLLDLLAATDIESKQSSFFPYNFRYIPVEMLSGVYESFLGAEAKSELAAYYTPRHLANLVVEQALLGSLNLLAEKIYDGACGSGILLTTAFRRLLGEVEVRSGGMVSLRDRISLLRDHIFGSDLSEAACRVTAFSLYLSLLERLQPADITALCEDAQVKLPTLRGENLFYGREQGDFFSPNNPLAQRRDISLYLSNPPWMELGATETWVDRWSAEELHPRPLHQIAADFAWRATQIASPGARLCLILPMTLLLKPTSQDFVAAWLTRVRWHRLINFGDLKELLFDESRASCGVLMAERRRSDEQGVPGDETFDYWVPKADVSLAFGRLTLHGADRHTVQTQAIARSNRELITRMWGDGFDLALWSRLRRRGTFADMLGKDGRWTRRKGFHRIDNAASAIRRDSRVFRRLKFVQPQQLYDVPVLRVEDLDAFQVSEIPQFTGTPEELLSVFDGPRVVFPDGPAPDGTIRAAYIEGPAAFMSSVGVIKGPRDDADLLRFAAMYLRSDLVRYFSIMQLYQRVMDRDRVSLRDIAAFPFYPPERHPEPNRAREIVTEVATLSRSLEIKTELLRRNTWAKMKPNVDCLMAEYFGITGADAQIVRESVEVAYEYVRPYGLKKVFELAQRRVDNDTALRYAEHLRRELESWRRAQRGEGEFDVQVQLTNPQRSGAFGIVAVRVGRQLRPRSAVARDDQAVNAVIKELLQRELLPVALQEHFYLAADTLIVAGDTMYWIKPQSQRLWLLRQAQRDARRIVEAARAADLRHELSTA